MRFISLAAALCLAAPAAAQQLDGDSIAEAAARQMLANQGDVQDYSLVLVHGGVRLPAYVYRDGEGWHVEVPGEESSLSSFMSMAVVWPDIAWEMAREEDDTDLIGDARYLGTETIGGRLAHVMSGEFSDDGERYDSLHVYVDAESHQLLRIAMVMPADDEDEDEALRFTGNPRVTVDLGDYTDHDGLILPMRMRVRMNMGLELSPEGMEKGRESLAIIRAELQAQVQALEGEEAEYVQRYVQMELALLESMMLRGEVDLRVTVEDVRVNPGPPAWMEEGGTR